MDPKEPIVLARPRRWRYLIDIIVLVALSFALPIGFGAVYKPKTMQSEFVFAAIVQLLGVAIAWMLIRLRREKLADIGLKEPENWWRTIMIGLVAAAFVFAAMYISEKAGFRRDLSRFKDAKGNLELTVYGVFYALIGAGFYEEFMFRGFLMQGLAMLFGGNRVAWIVACVLQGAFFGAGHAYQNPLGIAITGTLGFCLGLLVLASGRNLWPAIIGHGLFDAGRFVLFYFQGPPVG
jgi:membrane protease YdiL (CAAX protease family)